jgi:hypothetical protein
VNLRNLINPGRRIDEKSKVQIAFPKIVLILIKNAPLFSPRITPANKKIVRVTVAPAVTNKTKAKG